MKTILDITLTWPTAVSSPSCTVQSWSRRGKGWRMSWWGRRKRAVSWSEWRRSEGSRPLPSGRRTQWVPSKRSWCQRAESFCVLQFAHQRCVLSHTCCEFNFTGKNIKDICDILCCIEVRKTRFLIVDWKVNHLLEMLEILVTTLLIVRVCLLYKLINCHYNL